MHQIPADMGPLDLLLHLLGFIAPALFLALFLPAAARWVLRRPGTSPFWRQSLVVFLAGVVVLVAGLAWFARDGKMATYAALVLVAATTQWVASRAWR